MTDAERPPPLLLLPLFNLEDKRAFSLLRIRLDCCWDMTDNGAPKADVGNKFSLIIVNESQRCLLSIFLSVRSLKF